MCELPKSYGSEVGLCSEYASRDKQLLCREHLASSFFRGFEHFSWDCHFNRKISPKHKKIALAFNLFMINHYFPGLHQLWKKITDRVLAPAEWIFCPDSHHWEQLLCLGNNNIALVHFILKNKIMDFRSR